MLMRSRVTARPAYPKIADLRADLPFEQIDPDQRR